MIVTQIRATLSSVQGSGAFVSRRPRGGGGRKWFRRIGKSENPALGGSGAFLGKRGIGTSRFIHRSANPAKGSNDQNSGGCGYVRCRNFASILDRKKAGSRIQSDGRGVGATFQ